MAGGAHVDAAQKIIEDDQNREELGLEPSTQFPPCLVGPSTLRVEYAHSALQVRLDEWLKYDILQDQPITIHQNNKQHPAIAKGVNKRGQLCVESNGKPLAIQSGDVSIRKL